MFGKPKKLVMCQACRAFVAPGDRVCPHCGLESVPALRIAATTEAGAFFSMLILGINILLFIAMTAAEMKNGRGAEALMSGASSPVLIDFGSFFRPLVDHGEWWRFITPNFIHIGVIHLLFNCYALYQIGPLTEEIYGSTKFIFIYLVTGIFAWIASYFFNIPGAGASGSICGIIGLMAVFGYRQGGSFGKTLMRSMVQWAAMTILIGFFIRANNVAHIGGLISGALLGLVIKGEHPSTANAAKVWNGLAIICVLLIVGSFALVGKNYGAQGIKQQAQNNILTLSRLVREADKTIKSPPTPQKPSDTQKTAKQLKSISEQISNLPSIDRKSDGLRRELSEVLDEAAAALNSESANSIKTTTPFNEIHLAWQDRINKYLDWEDSIIAEYDLIKTNEPPH
jgi:membrane associated rhomboid family serine protease